MSFVVLSLVALVMLPAVAYAQAAITGTVKDASGGVLPGVSVEASSPVLIEKIRTVVTDGTGQYKIVDLLPGTYTVTFALTGFSTVKRDGIQLSGSFTATINADLKVGTLEETVTVSGASPIIDVTNAVQQKVVDKALIEALPTGRSVALLANLVPGLSEGGSATNYGSRQDTGGAFGDGLSLPYIHGGRDVDYRQNLQGVAYSMGVLGTQGWVGYTPNVLAFEEVGISTTGTLGGQTSGVMANIVPRDGSNQLHGDLFVTYGSEHTSLGSNITQRVIDLGLNPASKNGPRTLYDIEGAVGGPIAKDKIWFFGDYRYNNRQIYVPGVYYNANANNPNLWTLAPDLSKPAADREHETSIGAHITWQVSPRNKISILNQLGVPGRQKDYMQLNAGTFSPEANRLQVYKNDERVQVVWTSPVTNRLLLDAAFMRYVQSQDYFAQPDVDLNNTPINPLMIPVTEQSTGINFRNSNNGTGMTRHLPNTGVNFDASYVTGSHAIKVGASWFWSTITTINYQPDNSSLLQYRFNGGTPNQLTELAEPYTTSTVAPKDIGIFAQDQWSLRRLTLSGAVRFDWETRGYPEITLTPSKWVPNLNMTFPSSMDIDWKDITPRMAAAYDLFGNGKTALKFSAGKYLVGTYSTVPSLSPAARYPQSVTRSWTDSNKNFVADCDLLNPLGQNLSAAGGDVCGQISNLAFGTNSLPAATNTLDPDLATGWGKRTYNWDFSVGLQQELRPNVGLNVGYFRKIYGNFMITENQLVGPADYTTYCAPIPVDARLPGGGGGTLCGLQDISADKFGKVNNLTTYSSNFGKQIEHWNGVDASVNARLQGGVTVFVGMSTGHANTDNCAVVAAQPSILPVGYSRTYCALEEPWLTQVKSQVVYTLPKVGVQVAVSYQNTPQTQISSTIASGILATAAISNTLIAPSLGRSLSGNATNATVQLIKPETVYGERTNQLDLRFGRTIPTGSLRTKLSLDIFNALNSDTVQNTNNTFGPAWLTPLALSTQGAEALKPLSS